MSGWTLALHGGSHNSNVALAHDSEILEVLELERFSRTKDDNFEERGVRGMEMLRYYLYNKYDINKVDQLLFTFCETPFGQDLKARMFLQDFWGASSQTGCRHHASHAANGFYQSPFEEAIVVSADGMGNDGCFLVYHAVRGRPLHIVQNIDLSLGTAYSRFLYLCGNDIRYRMGVHVGRDAGKLMGLTGLGKERPELTARAEACINSVRWTGPDLSDVAKPTTAKQKELAKRTRTWYIADYLSCPIDDNGFLYTEDRYDYALAWQKAWEKTWILKMTKHLMNPAYSHLPVVISGGTGLNILANTLFENVFQREFFVPVNPDDRGIGSGMLLGHIQPKDPVDITYLGAHVLGDMPANGAPLDMQQVAKDIVDGKIYGVMKGRSEVGARALGNRSIICHAVYPQMKDILNAKIKKREWYRPFAPMVRLEDVGKYFTRAVESRWMNFASLVRDEYKDKLPAITHTDGTARVQTVTREQNPFMYDLLTEIDRLTGVGVLLNTSFNVRGQPIITYTDQAWSVYEGTMMDGLIIEDRMWTKHNITV